MSVSHISQNIRDNINFEFKHYFSDTDLKEKRKHIKEAYLNILKALSDFENAINE